MRDATGEELADMFTAGVRAERTGVEVDELFVVPPLPNWCFQRDPQVLLGNGVIFGAMAAPARQPEAVLSRAIFRFHPWFRDVPVLHDPLEDSPDRHPFVETDRPRLEGGDVLVLSDEVVVVGLSERTNRTAVQALARCLARVENGPRWLIGVGIPARRAYMHLDTVMTVVDRNAVLVYPPVVTGPGPERASAFSIDLRAQDLAPNSEEGVLEALRRRGHDLEPLACGGTDPLRQQREQWTDGANALALAPGVILLYERNVATTEELSRHGFAVVKAQDLVLGKEEVDLEGEERVCLVVPSHELSRARGGPHCLTHPLERDAL